MRPHKWTHQRGISRAWAQLTCRARLKLLAADTPPWRTSEWGRASLRAALQEGRRKRVLRRGRLSIVWLAKLPPRRPPKCELASNPNWLVIGSNVAILKQDQLHWRAHFWPTVSAHNLAHFSAQFPRGTFGAVGSTGKVFPCLQFDAFLLRPPTAIGHSKSPTLRIPFPFSTHPPSPLPFPFPLPLVHRPKGSSLVARRLVGVGRQSCQAVLPPPVSFRAPSELFPVGLLAAPSGPAMQSRRPNWQWGRLLGNSAPLWQQI